MSLARTLQWLAHRAAPSGTFRRRLLRQGRHVAQTCWLRWTKKAGLPLDLSQPDRLNAFLRKCGASPLTANLQDAEQDEFGAERLALALLQRPEVRRRFPRALGEGEAGGYCRWLCSHAEELGLSPEAGAHLRRAFALRPGERVRQVYDRVPALRSAFPLALMPVGQRSFVRWLLMRGGTRHGLRAEEILWFLFECAEDPQQGVVATYLRVPHWQRHFPHGLTAFGWQDLLTWIRQRYGLPGRWLGRLHRPDVLDPIDELRLLHAATPALQTLAPRAFEDAADTARLIDWLRKGQSSREAGEPPAPRTSPLDAPWWAGFENGRAAGLLDRPGVNVLGHFCHPSGLREATRTTIRALHGAGVRTSCRDVPALASDLPERSAHLGLELFDTTLLHLAPEPCMDHCYPLSGLAARAGVYRIALWYWELENAPAEWARHAEMVQEVWAPSRFIAQAMRRIMPIPVIDMPPGVAVSNVAPLPRSHFGLPADRFLFLFLFDLCSVMERKNPLAVIRAWQQAFHPGEPVALAIKVAHGATDPEGLARLRHAAAECGVIVLERDLSRAESYGLLNACDAYVSLHRSEGFGLTMAEAMLLGKPVIATGYSGNLDFMTPDNSLLVDYERVTIARRLPFYRQGFVWAEPSVAHAAYWMRWLWQHPEEARALGARARAQTEALLSLEAAGQRMAGRLREISSKSAGRGLPSH